MLEALLRGTWGDTKASALPELGTPLGRGGGYRSGHPGSLLGLNPSAPRGSPGGTHRHRPGHLNCVCCSVDTLEVNDIMDGVLGPPTLLSGVGGRKALGTPGGEGRWGRHFQTFCLNTGLTFLAMDSARRKPSRETGKLDISQRKLTII